MKAQMHTAFLIWLAINTSGCGALSHDSPGDVVRSAYMAANAGRYSDAERLLSTELLAAVRGELGALAGGLKGIWDNATRNGSIDSIAILEEQVRGEGAAVLFQVYFRDGSKAIEEESLIEEKGEWKLTSGEAKPLTQRYSSAKRTVDRDLERLAREQRNYVGRHRTYAADLAALKFEPAESVVIAIAGAGPEGWAATGRHLGVAYLSCAIEDNRERLRSSLWWSPPNASCD